MAKRTREIPAEHRAKQAVYQREWLRRNPNYWREYYQRNREEQSAKSKAYHQKNREKILARRKAYVKFKGKWVRLPFVPRKGVCQQCGRRVGVEIKVTQLHHERYDEANPLAHTTELCVRCHRKRHAQEPPKGTRE